MNIRKAEERDIPRLNDLLYQVHLVHANGRPDIFRKGNKKYTDDELRVILADDETPVFVAVDENDTAMGYVFCILQCVKDSIPLMDRKTLYIDDLCVDEALRGCHIGSALYRFTLEEAKRRSCDAVTLNVWQCNESALRFYEACGMKPLKTVMEQQL